MEAKKSNQTNKNKPKRKRKQRKPAKCGGRRGEAKGRGNAKMERGGGGIMMDDGMARRHDKAR